MALYLFPRYFVYLALSILMASGANLSEKTSNGSIFILVIIILSLVSGLWAMRNKLPLTDYVEEFLRPEESFIRIMHLEWIVLLVLSVLTIFLPIILIQFVDGSESPVLFNVCFFSSIIILFLHFLLVQHMRCIIYSRVSGGNFHGYK